MLPLGGSGRSEEAGLATRGRRTGRPSDASLVQSCCAQCIVSGQGMDVARVKSCLCSLTMCTFCVLQKDADFCATCWPTGCSEELASECTRRRRVCGTKLEGAHQTCRCSGWRSGVLRGVKILGTLVGHADFRLQWMQDWKRRTNCGGLCRGCRTCIALGSCWCNVQPPGAHHLLKTQPPSHVVGYAAGHDEGMRSCHGELVGPVCPETGSRKVQRKALPPFPCVSVDWAFGQHG